MDPLKAYSYYTIRSEESFHFFRKMSVLSLDEKIIFLSRILGGVPEFFVIPYKLLTEGQNRDMITKLSKNGSLLKNRIGEKNLKKGLTRASGCDKINRLSKKGRGGTGDREAEEACQKYTEY